MDILRLEWFDVPFKVSTSDNHNNIATKSQPVHTYTKYTYTKCVDNWHTMLHFTQWKYLTFLMVLTISNKILVPDISLIFHKKYPESDKIPSNGSCILMWLRLKFCQCVMLHIPAQFNLLGCRSDNDDWHDYQFSHPSFPWEVFQRRILSQTTCPRSCRSPSLPGNSSATQSSEGALRVLGPRPLCWRLLLRLW